MLIIISQAIDIAFWVLLLYVWLAPGGIKELCDQRNICKMDQAAIVDCRIAWDKYNGTGPLYNISEYYEYAAKVDPV